MSEELATVKQVEPMSLVKKLAQSYNLETGPFLDAIKKTVMPSNANQAQTLAFLLVANQYNLNPFTKEIYAFPTRGGGIQPMVPIDGWLKMINAHPAFDGMAFSFEEAEGKLVSCTCTIWRKDRAHPFVVTEFYEECKMNTEPWNKKPRRMLMHKAAIQAGRYAFSFAGIIDEDEAEQYKQMGTIPLAADEHPVDAEFSDSSSGVSGLKDRLATKPVPEVETPEEAPANEPAPLPETRGELFFEIRTLMETLGWDREAILGYVNAYLRHGEEGKVTSVNGLNNQELKDLVVDLRSKL